MIGFSTCRLVANFMYGFLLMLVTTFWRRSLELRDLKRLTVATHEIHSAVVVLLLGLVRIFVSSIVFSRFVAIQHLNLDVSWFESEPSGPARNIS